jgi:prevent-host-death family protein
LKTVKIAELKDRLSEHLRAVERGAEVVVTDRNRPIARIVPLPAVRDGAHVIPPSRRFNEIRDRRHKPAGWTLSSTELLLEERRDR